MSDRDDFRERLERINQQQLALNGAAPGMWQDMTPVIDRLADIFDPAKNAQAAARYAANRHCPAWRLDAQRTQLSLRRLRSPLARPQR